MLAAFAGCLLLFNSCERHHPGELPELQQEHLHPRDAAEHEAGVAHPSPTSAATPTNFFPSPTP
jgi:hypothetical protein